MTAFVRRLVSVRIAIIALLMLVILVGVGNLWNEFYLNGRVTQNQKQSLQAQQQAQEQQQKAQKAAGAIVEQKLCASLRPLASLATLRPPSGDPATNPSRAFEQQLVQKLQPLANLASDIGCPEKPLY